MTALLICLASISFCLGVFGIYVSYPAWKEYRKYKRGEPSIFDE